MDEITLLRRARPEVSEPTEETLAHARARLIAHTRQAPADRADRIRQQVGMGPGGSRRTPYRVLAFAACAAVLAAVFVYSPLTGQQAPAGAAGLLTQASQQVTTGAQPAPGEYLKVTTHSEALSYLTDDSGQVTGAYVLRTVDENYVPADRNDEWVGVSFSLPADTFYGPAAVQTAAARDYAQSATAQDPTITRAAGGQFGNGELGGPANNYATTADLPSLPRDPAELLQDLTARTDGADSSQSVTVMTQISTLLSSGLVDPELTATMYRTLALLPEIEITERQATIDGQHGTAIGVTDDQGFATNEVIVDLDQGRFLGIRSQQITAQGPIPAGTTLWSTATTSSIVSTTP